MVPGLALKQGGSFKWRKKTRRRFSRQGDSPEMLYMSQVLWTHPDVLVVFLPVACSRDSLPPEKLHEQLEASYFLLELQWAQLRRL